LNGGGKTRGRRGRKNGEKWQMGGEGGKGFVLESLVDPSRSCEKDEGRSENEGGVVGE